MKNTQAFTLIELLVVVLIIGILASVALPQYQKAVIKTRYAALKSLTNALYQAEQTFLLANGEYTNDFDALSIETPAYTKATTTKTVTTRYFPWGHCMIATGTYAQAECINTKIKMRYTYYFSGVRYCVANTTEQNAIQNQVCKTETGHSQGKIIDYYTVWTY